jgi:hypothetical protein
MPPPHGPIHARDSYRSNPASDRVVAHCNIQSRSIGDLLRMPGGAEGGN